MSNSIVLCKKRVQDEKIEVFRKRIKKYIYIIFLSLTMLYKSKYTFVWVLVILLWTFDLNFWLFLMKLFHPLINSGGDTEGTEVQCLVQRDDRGTPEIMFWGGSTYFTFAQIWSNLTAGLRLIFFIWLKMGRARTFIFSADQSCSGIKLTLFFWRLSSDQTWKSILFAHGESPPPLLMLVILYLCLRNH